MKYILIVFVLILSGCSYKTSELFEDLFADNHVIKAEGQYKRTVERDPSTPIFTTKEKTKKALNDNKPVSYRGKIASVHFDRDFNLYVYTFIDHITKKPVIFYYDKNIQQKKYNGDYRIVVNGNYLITYKQINDNRSYQQSTTADLENTKPVPVKRRYKKRKRSSIKVPIEEKINPL